MSHETPQSHAPQPIDAERPYLMPRDSGEIEVWHVETKDDGTPVVDENGWIMLSAQHEEQNKAGNTIKPSRTVHSELLGDQAQSFFADQLGRARVGATPEQFERYAHVEEDLAVTALEATGLENDDDNEATPETAEIRQTIAVEFAQSAELADGLVDNLKRPGNDESSRSTRRYAADGLNELVRTMFETSRVPSRDEYEQVVDALQKPMSELHDTKEYMRTSESVRSLAAEIDASRYRADGAAVEYFSNKSHAESAELIAALQRGKSVQAEMSALIDMDISMLVKKIDREDASVDETLKDIKRRLMYLVDDYNDTTAGNLYASVQDMLFSISESDGARHNLDFALTKLTAYSEELKHIRERIIAE